MRAVAVRLSMAEAQQDSALYASLPAQRAVEVATEIGSGDRAATRERFQGSEFDYSGTRQGRDGRLAWRGVRDARGGAIAARGELNVLPTEAKAGRLRSAPRQAPAPSGISIVSAH